MNASIDSGLASVGWLLVLFVIVLVIGVCLAMLAAGVGGYLAMKSLLLGVNPEALEKVRGQRERKAIRQREIQRRKTLTLERKHELQLARQGSKDTAAVARTQMRNDEQPQIDNSAKAMDQWLGFFQGERKSPPESLPLSEETLPAPTMAMSAAGTEANDRERGQ